MTAGVAATKESNVRKHKQTRILLDGNEGAGIYVVFCTCIYLNKFGPTYICENTKTEEIKTT